MALNQEDNFDKIKDIGRAVFLITFNKDHSKILMLKRNIQKRDFWGVSWGNIGGKIDPGESSTEAIIRETLEESGMRFNEKDLKLLHIKEIQNAKKNWHPIHFFYGASIDENREVNINLESEEYCWFELDDLPKDMFDSKEFILFLKSIFITSS